MQNINTNMVSFLDANYQQYLQDPNLQQFFLASQVVQAMTEDNSGSVYDGAIKSEAEVQIKNTQKKHARKSTIGLQSMRASQHPDFPRPYVCTVCEKRFILAHHLVSHALIHTGVRPHECQLCLSRFTQASSLKRHQSKIHNLSLTGSPNQDGPNRPNLAAEGPNLSVKDPTLSASNPNLSVERSNLSAVGSNLRPNLSAGKRSSGKGRHRCSQCGHRFTTKFSLNRHQPVCPGVNVIQKVNDILIQSGSHAVDDNAMIVNEAGNRDYPQATVNDSGDHEGLCECMGGASNSPSSSTIKREDLRQIALNTNRNNMMFDSSKNVPDDRGMNCCNKEMNESDIDDAEQNSYELSPNDNDLTEIDSLVVDALKKSGKLNNNEMNILSNAVDVNQLAQSGSEILVKPSYDNAAEAVCSYDQSMQLPSNLSCNVYEQSVYPQKSVKTCAANDWSQISTEVKQEPKSSGCNGPSDSVCCPIVDSRTSTKEAQPQNTSRRSTREMPKEGQVANLDKSEDRPFKCSECHWAFRLQHHLINHMSTHSSARPYTCYACSHPFSQISSLKRHVDNYCPSAAASDDPARFGCNMCHQKFLSTRALKQHIKVFHCGTDTSGISNQKTLQ